MDAVIQIIGELATEILEEFKLSKREVLHKVVEAAVEVTQEQKPEPECGEYDANLIAGRALNKIKAVNVIDGDPIPAYQLEALKELIKKVALRKIRELEEEQLRKKGHGKKGQKKV